MNELVKLLREASTVLLRKIEPNLSDSLRDAADELERAEPFAYCFTDVNGRPVQFADPAGSDSDPRIYTPLYRHPPSAVPDDTKRLDWLEQNAVNMTRDPEGIQLKWWKNNKKHVMNFAHRDTRKAIDAAMLAAAQQEGE